MGWMSQTTLRCGGLAVEAVDIKIGSTMLLLLGSR